MNRDLALALACFTGIVIITFISASGIGFSAEVKLVDSLPRASVLETVYEGQGGLETSGPVAATVTYTNSFLPRLKQLPQPLACLYDSASRRGVWLGAQWRLAEGQEGTIDYDNTLELGRGSRSVELVLSAYQRYVPREPVPAKQLPDDGRYDSVVIFIDEPKGGLRGDYSYVNCDNLQPGELSRGKRIPLVG